MNWLSKLDSLLVTLRAEAYAHWEVAAILGMCSAILCCILAWKAQGKRREMRVKMRIFRYCHNCPYADLSTETCSIEADRLDRCGLIDRQAGMNFSVTKLD